MILSLVLWVLALEEFVWLSDGWKSQKHSLLSPLKSNKTLFLRAKSVGFGPTSFKTPETVKSRLSQDIVLNKSTNLSKLAKDLDLSIYNPNFSMNYPGLKILYVDPLILEIEEFLPLEICENYIKLTESDGIQVVSQTFSPMTSSARTSTTWYMYYKSIPELISNAFKLTKIPISNYEEPQIVRYEIGQQFYWHYDAVPTKLLENGGQRVMTLLVYLNDVEAGGSTIFKDLKLKVTPKKGKALIFFPSFANGTSDDRTLHAGQMAVDTKWIAQMWIHEYPYEAVLPPNNKQSEVILLS